MFNKTRIGLGRGEFYRVMLTRETCPICGKFTRVYMYDGLMDISYHCANPNCREDNHGNITNTVQSIASQQED